MNKHLFESFWFFKLHHEKLSFAYETLKTERMIGTMLPCNVIVQKANDDKIEVPAIDPIASMLAVENPALAAIASEVQAKLKQVIAVV